MLVASILLGWCRGTATTTTSESTCLAVQVGPSTADPHEPDNHGSGVHWLSLVIFMGLALMFGLMLGMICGWKLHKRSLGKKVVVVVDQFSGVATSYYTSVRDAGSIRTALLHSGGQGAANVNAAGAAEGPVPTTTAEAAEGAAPASAHSDGRPGAPTPPTRSFFTTRTGKKFHSRRNCYGLRHSAGTFEAEECPADLTLCILCARAQLRPGTGA
jgi:hypothetical protein